MKAINDYFPEDYYSARDFFKKNLDKKEKYISKKIKNNLTFDAMIHKPSAKKRILLIISAGVHGVEAKAGFAFILKIMEDYKPKLKNDVGLLIMPYINPFGFAYGRRFNENNVDLNRNCLDDLNRKKTDKKFLEFQKKLFAQFYPKKKYNCAYFLKFIFNFIYARLKYNNKSFTQAIAGGQYFDEKVIFFGGRKLENSIKIAKKITSEFTKGYETAIIWDIHFGLGKSKELRIIAEENNNPELCKTLKNIFPNKIKSEKDMEYESKGLFSDYMLKYSQAKKTLNFESEIGTYGVAKTLFALIKENQIFYYNKEDFKRKEKIKKKMFELFCPKNIKWRKNALKLADYIMQGLNKKFELLKD